MSKSEIQFNKLTLHRFPKTKDQSLRAWSAADEYLCEWIEEQSLDSDSSIAIINDQFGALTCSLSRFAAHCWTDSFLSRTAIEKNLIANHLDLSRVSFVNQTNTSIDADSRFALVVIRIPKHNSLLEFQLETLRKNIDKKTVIVAAGMTKDIHKSNLKLFESVIGETTTSLAKKKARLIFCKPSLKANRPTRLNELKSQFSIKHANKELAIIGLPGVFSREGLDIGSRVLLNYLPETRGNQKLIDLGCGTGVLGTAMAINNPELEVTFTDESWLATESAKQTYNTNNDSLHRSAFFFTNDVLAGISQYNFDFILCNPPFHQQNVQTLSIARKMFKESANKLAPDGELRVVANRHLKYRPILASFFNDVDMISDDSKFVVWLARKPKR